MLLYADSRGTLKSISYRNDRCKFHDAIYYFSVVLDTLINVRCNQILGSKIYRIVRRLCSSSNVFVTNNL